MDNPVCVSCLKPKASLSCDVCEQDVCKSCAQFLADDAFSFLEEIPEDLSHSVYCRSCFETSVQPELDSYEATMEAARAVSVYDKSMGKATRSFSRRENLMEVKECPDRDEAILRLAFLAAKAGFDAIIDLDLSSRKVRNGSYQHLVWSATARPVKLGF